MLLEAITLVCMLGTVLVKWVTATALQQKQSRLAEANEEAAKARQRLKQWAGEAGIADREIGILTRAIKSSKHRIAKMETELGDLRKTAEEAAQIDQAKIELAGNVRERKGPA